MTDVIVAQRMWQRRDTAANWAAENPVLAAGEIGFVIGGSNPLPQKTGDGVTAWLSLPFAGGGNTNAGLYADFDGGNAALAGPAYCDLLVPWNCTIVKSTLLADAVGSLVLSVWVDAYGSFPPTVADNICGTHPPTLTSAAAAQDATLTGWTVSLVAGTVIRFGIVSATTIKRASLCLQVTKT